MPERPFFDVPKQANGSCGVCARFSCDGECCVVNDSDRLGLFLKAGKTVFSSEDVERLDLSSMEESETLLVKLKADDDWIVASGFDAIEILMAMKPSAAEGTRLRFRKHAWAFHNLIGHPVMQVLAWMGFKRSAIRFHDWSAPSARDYVGVAK